MFEEDLHVAADSFDAEMQRPHDFERAGKDDEWQSRREWVRQPPQDGDEQGSPPDESREKRERPRCSACADSPAQRVEFMNLDFVHVSFLHANRNSSLTDCFATR